jgi:hypothetical protein
MWCHWHRWHRCMQGHWQRMHDFCVRKSIISRRMRSRIQKGFSPWIRGQGGTGIVWWKKLKVENLVTLYFKFTNYQWSLVLHYRSCFWTSFYLESDLNPDCLRVSDLALVPFLIRVRLSFWSLYQIQIHLGLTVYEIFTNKNDNIVSWYDSVLPWYRYLDTFKRYHVIMYNNHIIIQVDFVILL